MLKRLNLALNQPALEIVFEHQLSNIKLHNVFSGHFNLFLNILTFTVFSTITFLLPYVDEKQLKNDLSAEF